MTGESFMTPALPPAAAAAARDAGFEVPAPAALGEGDRRPLERVLKGVSDPLSGDIARGLGLGEGLK